MKKSPRRLFAALLRSIDQKVHTRRGRSVLLYVMCFIVAFMFWTMIALDETTERDFEVPLTLVNVPDSVVVVGDVPKSVNVVIKGKGTQFLRYIFNNVPTLEIDYRQYSAGGSRILLSRSLIDVRLREMFGQNTDILAVTPDSISVGFSSGRGFRLPLKVNSRVSASPRSVISGPVMASSDSVSVYTVGGVVPDIDCVETELLVCKDLTDTLVCDLAVKQMPGMRIRPERVRVTVPAELLVSKRRTLPVTSVNVPEGMKLMTYPLTVEVSYLVPMRMSSDELPIKVYVDYNSISGLSRNAKINVTDLPGDYRFVSVSLDSVEYVIER